MMRVVDLFAGIGVGASGIPGGFELVAAYEWDVRFARSYNSQGLWPPVCIPRTVDKAGRIDADVVIATPPCDAFSKGNHFRGSDFDKDWRNQVPAFLRFMARNRAPYVVFENVPKLLGSNYWGEIWNEMASLGYKGRSCILNAQHFGLPQSRQRVIAVWSLDGKWSLPRLAIPQRVPIIEDILSCAPFHDDGPLFWKATEHDMNRYYRHESTAAKHRAREAETEPFGTVVACAGKDLQYRIFKWQGEYYHAGPRLLARAQGLPDAYKFGQLPRTAAYEGVGGGFPAPFVRTLLNHLLECI